MPMRYRLALDLGTASLGWCLLRLNGQNEPTAVIRAGVRIFSDGRDPQDGTSLAVTRREARQMRRRRDRLLKRKAKLTECLIRHGFLPGDLVERKLLERLDPYALRAKGLDHPLGPGEFGRAVFHLNQRRGFKSNRRTDRKDNERGPIKAAIRGLRERMLEDRARTVGEWLWRRHEQRLGVRARRRGTGSTVAYDLYIDRQLVEDEFDQLWARQRQLRPDSYPDTAHGELKGILLFQRPLKPVSPGRCTFLPDLERAPIALPSAQRFRIYQEVNNLRVVTLNLAERPLTLAERDQIVRLLERERGRLVAFDKLGEALRLGPGERFNLEDAKRKGLDSNKTSVVLAGRRFLGEAWHRLAEDRQEELVERLLSDEDEHVLVGWLQEEFEVDEARATLIAEARLPDGYGRLSREAIARILPELRGEVVTYADAALRAGFDHSALAHAQQTGEVMPELPYYGEYLQRHVGFGTGIPDDPPEKRFGRIANPTVHIGLNQVRRVVNALIRRYGQPSEVVVEVARDLKNSRARAREIQQEQAVRQRQNERWREELEQFGVATSRLNFDKMRLWTELHPDPSNRCCPYTGERISLGRLFSEEVEIEHILPFQRTWDDSLNNRTVALRRANRDKGDRTPWEAFGERPRPGYDWPSILERVQHMPREKRFRFAEDGYQRLLRGHPDFLARALNDTAYLSRVAKEYLSLVCPFNQVRASPGRLTALLRAKFGLNNVLGLAGEKNRDDHRHHAVDAAVIGVTDHALLRRVAQASASARARQLDRLLEETPEPWPRYREHVQRAVEALIVSHRPDHAHEGKMHDATAYGLRPHGEVVHHKVVDGQRVRTTQKLKVIEMAEPAQGARHGTLPDGSPRPYKGYQADSNYCLEVARAPDGRWSGRVVTTFDAYQIVLASGLAALRDPRRGANGKPLLMRLVINDYVKLVLDGAPTLCRVVKISGNGDVTLAPHHEANVRARNDDKADAFRYISKRAGSLRKARGRRVTVSPIGDLRDPGFRD